MMTKSEVAMLKKYELHDRTERQRTRLIQYTTIGLLLSGRGAAEVVINLTEELRHAETNPTCVISESYCTSH